MVVLGHRRLAILDLSDRARQPMAREGVSLTFNGEIYNYVELRAELQSLGYSFTTTSDTEVLLQAYREWGVRCLGRLNGIFAFVIWDEHERRLIAARDRMGVKPLYWAVAGGCLMMASEIRALKVALGQPDINEGLVYDFLLNGRLDHSNQTFLEGIQRLPAGSWLDLRAGAWSVTRYFRLEPSDLRHGRSFDQNVEEFGALFRDAVTLQMRADVPVACCLSGGLDSTAVAAVASLLTPTPMSVFTARYRNPQADEWRYAAALHAERDVVPIAVFAEAREFWTHLGDVVRAQEEPFGGPSVFAQWRLMQEIKARGIKVVLDGQGGDELLCGYAKYFYFHLADLLRSGRPLMAAAAALSAVATGGPQLLNLSGARRYLPGPWWLDRRKKMLLKPEFLAQWQGRQVAHPRGSVVDQQVLDLTQFGLPTLLRYEDKNSMAHGVESRVPFLDHRLVEFALSVPVDHKIRGARAKLLLREALKGTLPEPIRRRRSKLGFGGAWHVWVADLATELAEWLGRPRLAVDRFVNRDALREMLRRQDAAIFSSLILDRWLQLEQRDPQ
jgi:asparagine synthase (glutamine-hydrolysing)